MLIRLLLFTGARSGEWRVAEWSWLDADGRTLRLPDAAAKAGARWIALSTSVQALLSAAPRTSRFIVPDDSGEAPLAPWTAIDAWQTVCRAAKVDDLNLHDLRHAFATRGAGLGASAVVLRDALGHKTLQITSRYVSRQNDPVRELVERVGGQIRSLSEPAADRVVDFAKRLSPP